MLSVGSSLSRVLGSHQAIVSACVGHKIPDDFQYLDRTMQILTSELQNTDQVELAREFSYG